ncbi:NAD(P)-dependent oxidoreductase [Nocardia arizonensis]|uniref:NAD(P)-dependent oxidoreductase n=1 Tax=Nocardia arizonensis TaxID=1141647 RepID=UPI000AB3A262|nr:NAD(P)-dependent oxidoreductase [Nocardia arizonensis]
MTTGRSPSHPEGDQPVSVPSPSDEAAHRRRFAGRTLDCPDVLIVNDGYLKATWPFLADRLREGLVGTDHTLLWETVPASSHLRDIRGVDDVRALVLIGVEPEPADLAALSRLAVVAGVGGVGSAVAAELAARGIAYVDGSRGHTDSRAEHAIALVLAALRSLPSWHTTMAVEGPRAWPLPSWQYSDHPGLVNGTLRGKTVAVVGLGPLGARVAELCAAFGATVAVADPDADEIDVAVSGAQRIDLEHVSAADIVVVTEGTPRSRLTAAVLDRLRAGSLVVTLDAAGIDLAALRERVLRGELAWATDVYETVPVPLDDPILGRDNVVHTPGIAGRTREANHGVADVLVENIARVLRGGQPWPWDRLPFARPIPVEESASSDGATQA